MPPSTSPATKSAGALSDMMYAESPESSNPSRRYSPTPSAQDDLEEIRVQKGAKAGLRRVKERLFGTSGKTDEQKHEYQVELERLDGALKEPTKMVDRLIRAVGAEVAGLQGFMTALTSLTDTATELGDEEFSQSTSFLRNEHFAQAVNLLGNVNDSLTRKQKRIVVAEMNLQNRELLATDVRYYKRKVERLEQEKAAALAADKPVDEQRLARNKAKFLSVKEELENITKALIGELSSFVAIGRDFVKPEMTTIARVTAILFSNSAEKTKALLAREDCSKTLEELNEEVAVLMNAQSAQAIANAQRSPGALTRGESKLLRSRSTEPPSKAQAPPPPDTRQFTPPAGGVRLPFRAAANDTIPPPLPPKNKDFRPSDMSDVTDGRQTDVFSVRNETVVVEHAYQADGPDELTIQKGDVIEVLQKDESGWWRGQRVLRAGRNIGMTAPQQSGWFPASHVKPEGA